MQLGALVQGFEVSPAQGTAAGWESCRVCDLTEDSRTVVQGSMFVARAGGKADGKAFIGSALSAGATVILCDDESAAGLAHGVPVLVARDIAKVGRADRGAFLRVAECAPGDHGRDGDQRQDDHRPAWCGGS